MINSNLSQKISPLIGIIFIILLAMTAWLIIDKFSGKNEPSASESNNNQNNQKIEIHAYTGIVKNVDDEKIIFEAKKANNNLTEDKILTALISEKTLFNVLKIPKLMPTDNSPIILANVPTTIKSVKVGAEITVTSQENIKDKDEFEVSKVDIITVSK